MFEIPRDRGGVSKATWLFAAIALFAVILISLSASFSQAFSPDSVSRHSLITNVTRSSFNVTVSGYGKFVPVIQRGINANSGGNIIELFKKPGSLVQEGEIILSLSNPKLQRSMETSELALLDEKSNLQRIKAESEQELEDQRGKIRLATVKLALASAELAAHKKLKDSQVISVLELHKAQVAWDQEDTLLQMEVSRLKTLIKTRKAIEESGQYKLQKVIKERELLVSEVEQLNIRASMTGMLTELTPELDVGRYVDEGQAVGMIADLTTYYARINITAADAEYVNPSLLAKVQFKGTEMQGKVTRVDPTVNNGSVEIDISFQGDIPTAVRPSMDVNARIEIANHLNTLVINRPVGITRSHREYPIFVLNNDTGIFTARTVAVGDITAEQIQVLGGISLGDSILLRVPEHLSHMAQIRLAEIDE
jgi:multidrug efflux pump subunit AcrA (membrane-fusion protein)